MKIKEIAAVCEKGKRPNNEDSIYPAKGKASLNDRFFMVCDGMGGHESGEVASGAVCEAFSTYINSQPPGTQINEEVFQKALWNAYDLLDEKDSAGITGKTMGTTLTFLAFNPQGALMAHIGDSRIYQLRPREKAIEIVYQSRDDSLVQDLRDAGILKTEEEMRTHSKKNVITRAMQPHQDKRCEAKILLQKDVKPGDIFFLCSDGIVESIWDNDLRCIIGEYKTAQQMMDAIAKKCDDGSKDNYSAYLIITEDEERVMLPEDMPPVPVKLDVNLEDTILETDMSSDPDLVERTYSDLPNGTTEESRGIPTRGSRSGRTPPSPTDAVTLPANEFNRPPHSEYGSRAKKSFSDRLKEKWKNGIIFRWLTVSVVIVIIGALVVWGVTKTHSKDTQKTFKAKK